MFSSHSRKEKCFFSFPQNSFLFIHLVYNKAGKNCRAASQSRSSDSLLFPERFHVWWQAKLHSASKVYREPLQSQKTKTWLLWVNAFLLLAKEHISFISSSVIKYKKKQKNDFYQMQNLIFPFDTCRSLNTPIVVYAQSKVMLCNANRATSQHTS